MALGAFNSLTILMTWPAPIVLFNGSFVVSPEKKEREKEEHTKERVQHLSLEGEP